MRTGKSRKDLLAETAFLTLSMEDTLIDTCTFQDNSPSTDGGGGIIENWANIPNLAGVKCYGSKHKSNDEEVIGDRQATANRFVLHLMPSLAPRPVPRYRVLWQGGIYEIANVYSPTSDNPFLTLHLVER